ncbi:LPXTG cell wall anchor domain-containing protein [Streptomyces sp. D2-8]|uniref:SCO1860 family LAETG-anchored protein n=1 Tax=Streptomyces sp. D2-8 TaxID=2707767 RepID=UPI0020BE55C2|nr:SCO1860 family LAETG-anchored protein [Streptomyces sp. D2-8]MCK8432604.1 LPXTG cell wall anchor domain-containing protein [Streptomyces sp. D2-8]
MNSTFFRVPVRRLATVATAMALAAGPMTLTGVSPAYAAGDHGRASAATLRTGLDVSLLNKSVNVPLAVSLNEVQAPQSAEETTLTARLDAVNGGRPFSVLRAEVAQARATTTATKAEAAATLAHARLHVPGLPLLAVIEVEQITSKATCEVGEKPVATTDIPGSVTVLGERVNLTAEGSADVKVPGVGEVHLDLSSTRTTARSAAATALELKVSVDPLKLNVAEVDGTLTLAEAACKTPAPAAAAQPSAEASAPPADAEPAAAAQPSAEASAPPADAKPQGALAEESLAETGGDSTTPYLVGGGIALLVAGGGAVVLTRRRS